MARTKSFIVYNEEERMEDARLEVELVEKAHEVLEVLHTLQPNLAFPRKVVEDSLSALFEEKKGAWSLGDHYKADWVLTLGRRLRNLARVVAQGELRSPGASWVKRLPWNVGKDEEKQDKEKKLPKKIRKKPMAEGRLCKHETKGQKEGRERLGGRQGGRVKAREG